MNGGWEAISSVTESFTNNIENENNELEDVI